MEVKTTHKGAAAPIVINYEFGTSLEQTVELFGKEKTHAKAVGGFVIELQNYVRKLMQEGKHTVDEIIALAKAWKPGVSGPRVKKPAKDKFLESFASMTPEQQAELLAQLQAKAGGNSAKKAKAA